MFCDGTKSIVVNQMHARIPNQTVMRDRWVNLCIDVNSFIKECFTRNASQYGTPQQVANQHQGLANNGQKGAPAGGCSGDIAAFHKGNIGEITGAQISKVAAVMAKNA